MTERRGGTGKRRGRIGTPWGQAGLLALTETVSWGILYYAFVALLVPMRDDLGWSEGRLTFAYSLGILVSGLAAPLVGIWLDRHSSRPLMTIGSLGGAALVFAWSRIGSESTLLFPLIWLGLGIVMSGTLYEPAFATVTRWFVRDRARPLLLITICAGFASTIFLPLTTWLADQYGWRRTLEVHAVLLLALTFLPHLLFLCHPPVVPTGPAGPVDAAGATLREATRLGRFWRMTAAFGIQWFASTAVTAFLIAYLVERGDSAGFAAAATGAIGAAQVVARILTTMFGQRLSAITLAAIMHGLQGGAVVILLLWPDRVGVALAVLLLGAGRGAITLIRPVILLETFGQRAFASISGTQSAITSVCGAIAPVSVGLAYGALTSYTPIMWCMAGLGLASSVLMLTSRQNR